MDGLQYKEVSDCIKAVLDLTGRVDERVKMLIERNVQMDAKIEAMSRSQSELTTKVSILETRDESDLYDELADIQTSIKEMEREIHNIDLRLSTVEKITSSQEQKWRIIFGFIRDTIWVIVVCYLLWRLGLQDPPMP